MSAYFKTDFDDGAWLRSEVPAMLPARLLIPLQRA